MYWQGKNRGYVEAISQPERGGFAGGRAGTWLQLMKKQDLFTGMDYYEAVDAKKHRARVGIADSQWIMARIQEGRKYQCYYVKTRCPGREILVFCAGTEIPDDEMSAALFEMPE